MIPKASYADPWGGEQITEPWCFTLSRGAVLFDSTKRVARAVTRLDAPYADQTIVWLAVGTCYLHLCE